MGTVYKKLVFQYEEQKGQVRHRQPSIVDDSSSSDEDTLKESEVQRHSKEKNRFVVFQTV